MPHVALSTRLRGGTSNTIKHQVIRSEVEQNSTIAQVACGPTTIPKRHLIRKSTLDRARQNTQNTRVGLMPPARVIVTDPPPSPLSNDLRNELIGALFSQTKAIPDLQQALLAECEKSGWLSAIRERATQLIKEDDNRDHNDIVRMIVEEARQQGVRNHARQGVRKPGNSTAQDPAVVDVRMPEQAVQEGTKIIRGAFDGIVEIEGTAQ